MASKPFGAPGSSSPAYNSSSKPIPVNLSIDSRESDDDYGHKYYNDIEAEYHGNYTASNYASPPVGAAVGKPSASTLTLTTNEDGIDPVIGDVGAAPGWGPPAKGKRAAGLREAFYPDSVACRLYLMVVVLETFCDLCIESILLARVNQALDHERTNNNTSTPNLHLARSRIPVYLGIFGMAHIFQFGLALDAVYYKNVLQFIFLAIFNALFFLYAVIQINEVQETLAGNTAAISADTVLTIIIPIVVAVAEIAYVALGWKIYREFGWQIFKLIGADRSMKRIYVQYQIFGCFMRFDMFFWLSFSVQLVALVLQKGDFEYYITILALPVSILLIYVGHRAARQESRAFMGVFGFGLVAALVYFCYKLFRIWSQRKTDTYVAVYKTLTIFDSISLALILFTGVWAFLVFRNFDQGLKQHLNKSRQARRDEIELSHNPSRYPPGDARHLHRMSIE